MEDLKKFVSMWDKTGKIEDILSQNLILPPSADVQAYLSTLSSEDSARIRDSLDGALKALASHTATMEEEAAEIQSQIDQNMQTSNACLVYNNTGRKPRS